MESSVVTTSAPSQRLVSLDAFRGMTIASLAFAVTYLVFGWALMALPYRRKIFIKI